MTLFTHLIGGQLSNARNQWTPATDSHGSFLYFVPSIRLTVNENTEEITAVALRWFAWNPQSKSFDVFDEEFDGHDWGSGTSGVTIQYEQEGFLGSANYDVSVGSAPSVPEANHWSAPAGEKQITEISPVSPFLVGIAATYDCAFPLQPE